MGGISQQTFRRLHRWLREYSFELSPRIIMSQPTFQLPVPDDAGYPMFRAGMIFLAEGEGILPKEKRP